MSLQKILGKKASDIVILSALRTPITKAKKGGLAKMYPEELAAAVLKATVAKTGISPSEVNEVMFGTVLPKLCGHKVLATAVKHCGFPLSTTVSQINRQCSSSAQAVAALAGAITLGSVRTGLSVGVESMTMDYFPHRGIPERMSPIMKNSPIEDARNVVMPMGITSENVAAQFGISREAQDEFALKSHEKAVKARKSGHFSKEIVPVEARYFIEEEPEKEKWHTISQDDGIREGLTLEKLAGLPGAFKADGTTTAGNSSQVSDGAAAVLVTTRAEAEKLGIAPIGKFVGYQVSGVPSHLMGIAPSVAIPDLLQRFGITTEDIDVWELNEAFASQSVYCINKLGLDESKVNPFGGAIALGHPLGATGARCIATLMNGLQETGGKIGVVSMCASTGQGFASLFVKE